MIKRFIVNALRAAGYEIHRSPRRMRPVAHVVPNYQKIHYASARKYLDGWLNVDIIANGPDNYMYVNLVERHPFPDNLFNFAFCEDFIEHVDQASALMFLMEAYRTIAPGGVLRLTTPDLDKVLPKHYRKRDFNGFEVGREEAYTSFGHIHFFSTASLRAVANYIGFDTHYVEGGSSIYPELDGINTRSDEVYLHAELVKPVHGGGVQDSTVAQ